MNNYVTIDTIIFIVSNFVLGMYVFKHKELKLKEKIAYTLFFIIINSSYNIMFVKIHENNTVIARDYIYRAKFIGPFTLLDIICIIFICINIKQFITILKNKFI